MVVVNPHTQVNGCRPVYFEVPFLSEGNAEMVFVGLVGVLDEEVVHHKSKVGIRSLMSEYGRCVGALEVSVGTKHLAGELMGKTISLV